MAGRDCGSAGPHIGACQHSGPLRSRSIFWWLGLPW
jgi:hypothetical protein